MNKNWFLDILPIDSIFILYILFLHNLTSTYNIIDKNIAIQPSIASNILNWSLSNVLSNSSNTISFYDYTKTSKLHHQPLWVVLQ